jgi:hypothetical protein
MASQEEVPPEAAAWRDMCRRMEALGQRLLDPEFPSDPLDRTAGFAHLTEQLMCWLEWSVFHGDPRRPFFQRQNDLITQWGGPNADNVYRHARVEAGRRYRIRGRMYSCDDFILAVRAGFMHQPKWGTIFQVTASDLGLGPGDEIDLIAGEGGQIELPPDAVMISIREYYFDWQAEQPALFTIECLDDDAAVPGERRAGAQLAAQLNEAASATEISLGYWNTYMKERRSTQPDNTFTAPLKLEKGLDAARYLHCIWNLGPDDALVVDCDVPDARYWSWQLYQLGWFDLVDTVERQASLNHTDTAVDGNGRVRVVVSHRDPGVANWLDTGGRANGLLMLRWFWPRGADPAPTTSVVPVAELSGSVTPDQRADALRRRRSHLAWRFRT